MNNIRNTRTGQLGLYFSHSRSRDGVPRVRVVVPDPKYPRQATKIVTWTYWERVNK